MFLIYLKNIFFWTFSTNTTPHLFVLSGLRGYCSYSDTGRGAVRTPALEHSVMSPLLMFQGEGQWHLNLAPWARGRMNGMERVCLFIATLQSDWRLFSFLFLFLSPCCVSQISYLGSGCCRPGDTSCPINPGWRRCPQRTVMSLWRFQVPQIYFFLSLSFYISYKTQDKYLYSSLQKYLFLNNGMILLWNLNVVIFRCNDII